MISKYIGQYLLNQGYITSNQLKDALNYDPNLKASTEIIAIGEGYLNAKQVEEIVEAQKNTEKSFIETAASKGYLKDYQLDELEELPSYSNFQLIQSLVDKNYITLNDIYDAIINYKVEDEINSDEFESIIKDEVDEIVSTYIDLEESENYQVLKNYIALFVRNLINVTDSEAQIKRVYKVEEINGEWNAKQNITGSLNIGTVLEAPEEVFVKLASLYAEEEIGQMDEMAQASVGEFLNMVNGMFLVNMSNCGLELSVTPQKVSEGIALKDTFVVILELSFGKVRIFITE